jgi:RimJ/RimL family protein N-acetyltransferase
MAIEVRRLDEQDAESYRSIRLEALEKHPEAFQATYESAVDLPVEAYGRRLKVYTIFGGFLGGRLTGMVGFYRLKDPKIDHKAILWGMYVAEAARGSGLAEAMVEALLDRARADGVDQVMISVITKNKRARRFYEKMGFQPYGLAQKSLKIDGLYYDEEFRVRFLANPPG